MTKEQLLRHSKFLKSKGAKYFGVHAFLGKQYSNQRVLSTACKGAFELVVELKNETGCDIRFVKSFRWSWRGL